MPTDDWEDDRPLEEWEYPDPDESDDEQTRTQECPMCGADVYEDAEQCPSCGEWIEHSTHPFAGRSMWFIVLGVLGIAVTIAALVLAGF